MRSKNTSDSKHLLAILIVVLLSIAAWAVEERRSKFDSNAINEFLLVLNEFSTLPESPSTKEVILEANAVKEDKHSGVILTKYYRDVFKQAVSKPKVIDGSIDLNSVDSTYLESLPVFGPVLSSRVIRYREKLGGFISPRQLLDVYGLNDEMFSKVEAWFFCNESLVEKLCVDTASWKTLRAHPFIGKSGATVISNYAKHNDLRSLSQLKELPMMNDSTWGRWEPYIKICDID